MPSRRPSACGSRASPSRPTATCTGSSGRFEGVRVGKLSGRRRHLRLAAPGDRGAGDGGRWACGPRTSRPRWSPVTATPSSCGAIALAGAGPGAVRDRGAEPPADRGARGRGAVRRRAEGLLGDAAQAQPDPRRAAVRPGPRAPRLRADRPTRTSPSGTSATSPTPAPSGSCCPTPRSCSTTCSTSAARLARGMTVHADRMRANLELTHGALYSQRALTALVESGLRARRRLPDRPGDGPARVGRGTSFREPARGAGSPDGEATRVTGTRSSTRPPTSRTCRRCSSGSRRFATG